jgi:hypothetical protein
MHTYFAVSSKEHINGSLQNCIFWAFARVQNQKAKIIKIHKAKPNEKHCKIVFEVSRDQGLVATPHGRSVFISKLKNHHE